MKAATGEHIAGTYRQRLTLTSGRFGMIECLAADGGLGFQLVPWSPSLEKQLGRHVTGIARGDVGLPAETGAGAIGAHLQLRTIFIHTTALRFY